tara:strand:- start:30 stop:200 length:171 start_codon:yes stop_codon:yes gene_type:complete
MIIKKEDLTIGLYDMGKANKQRKREEKISMMVQAKLIAEVIEDSIETSPKNLKGKY